MSRLKTAAGALTGVGLLAAATIGAYETRGGKPDLVAYRDIVGVPTACFGETRGIKMGMTFTAGECKGMFGDALVEFEAGITKCIANPDAIPDKSYVAFLSLAYNIGQSAFCGSTLVKRINAGDLTGACNELLKWNKAGGKYIKGLANRRASERAMCIEGVRGQ